jgi:hypothetical protein
VNQDSILLANSETWKVESFKDLFGLSKSKFGPYSTIEVKRFDSTSSKRKVKDSSSLEVELSSEATTIDHGKYMTIEKTKFYNLQIASGADITNSLFHIASRSKEKRQTMLGRLMSKEEAGKTVIDYNRDVSGVITTGNESWEFFIDNFSPSGRRGSGNTYFSASISTGFLRNKHDSLMIRTSAFFDADIRLIDKAGTCPAALKFAQKPMFVWIRNDVSASQRNAIAAFFATILALKN